MGKVRMTERYDDKDFQVSYDYIYEYTYCDKCGSFDVGHSSILPSPVGEALVVIILVSYLAVIGVIVFFTSNWYLSCLIGLIGLVALIIIGLTSYLKCRKCGNKHITSDNVLNYSENDNSVLDVPHKSIYKHRIKITGPNYE